MRRIINEQRKRVGGLPGGRYNLNSMSHCVLAVGGFSADMDEGVDHINL